MIQLIDRLRTGTNVSLGGRSRAGTGGLRTAAMMTAADVGNANIATEARGRDRTLSDLDTIKVNNCLFVQWIDDRKFNLENNGKIRKKYRKKRRRKRS